MRRVKSIDLAKALMALVVVAIHVKPFGNVGDLLFPLYRMAVPVFAMISSYLLFRKVSSSPEGERDSMVLHALRRYALLYLFWLVVFLVPTVEIRGYLDLAPIEGVVKFLKNLLFSSTFVASWFLSGIVWCVLIAHLISRRLGNAPVVVAGLFSFVGAALMSNYAHVYVPVLSGVFLWYQNNVAYVYNSFPALLLFVALGKLYAENCDWMDAWVCKHRTVVASIAVTGAMFLLGERTLVENNGLGRANDVYLSLVICCPAIFALVVSSKIDRVPASLLRYLSALSTVTYCIHGTLNRLFLDSSIDLLQIDTLRYFVLILACALVTYALVALSRNERLRFLRVAF